MRVNGLGKRFGGLAAVKNVSFALEPGSITGLLGPNGAGKTTVFNLLTGFIAPDAGRIEFDGHSLVQVGLGEKAAHVVDVLPYGDLRRLEIARALATRPKLLLLDEPFAGLGTGEVEPIAELIRMLHRSEGLTILIIEHKLREFMQLVHEIIAMDFGEVVATGAPAAIVRHPRVVEAYIGSADIGPLGLEATGGRIGPA